MPEIINSKQAFTLLEVMRSIQKTLYGRYGSAFWVKAEMNKLNYYTYSGHCYPDLVEKKDGKVIAQIRSHLWRDDYNRINGNFIRVLNEPLKDGIKILFQAKISFDPVYGLSLQILDIDPGYTLGDLEREKQETINRLKAEGIFDLNRQKPFPLLPQRIAVISVETSKGYADFKKTIDENQWGYRFFHFLFPSLLQGEKAVDSIIGQLEKIKKVIRHFDVVAIIRGGGGDVGLSGYNDYRLAKAVALFPIPVITGIGHATNDTVTEMVAGINAITPTKIAEYLLQKFHNFAVPVQNAEEKIAERATRILTDENLKFQAVIRFFRSVTHNVLRENNHELRELMQSLNRQSGFLFKSEKRVLAAAGENMIKAAGVFLPGRHRLLDAVKREFTGKTLLLLTLQKTALSAVEKNVNNMSPENVLKRGYSITRLNGKVVGSISQVTKGDRLKTQVSDGEIISKVENSGQL